MSSLKDGKIRHFPTPIAFVQVFGSLQGRGSNNNDDLASTNPANTFLVAIFSHNHSDSKLYKKEYFYVCKFDASLSGNPIAKLKSYLLFSIYWDPELHLWLRRPWFACDEAPSQHEAGEWMLKQVTNKDANSYELDTEKGFHEFQANYFTMGTLNILDRNLMNRFRQRIGIFGNPIFLIGLVILQLIVSIYIGLGVFLLFGIRREELGFITSTLLLIGSFFVGGFVLTPNFKIILEIFQRDIKIIPKKSLKPFQQREKDCKPWLIGVLVAVIPLLVSLIYAIRHRDWRIIAYPIWMRISIALFIIPIFSEIISYSIYFQMFSGLITYLYVRRKKLSLKIDDN